MGGGLSELEIGGFAFEKCNIEGFSIGGINIELWTAGFLKIWAKLKWGVLESTFWKSVSGWWCWTTLLLLKKSCDELLFGRQGAVNGAALLSPGAATYRLWFEGKLVFG